MTLRAEGRRFVQEIRRNRRARQEAHQTIAEMPGGGWAGIVGPPLLGELVRGISRRAVEQKIDRHYNEAIAARVLPPA